MKPSSSSRHPTLSSLPKPILAPRRVSFDQCDLAGILFFANYLQIAHQCLEEYIPLIGINWKDWFASKHWGIPLRRTQSEHFQPLRANEEYRVDVSLNRLGESSVHFEFRFLNHEGTLVTKIETSHVFIDLERERKTKIPPPIRQLLRKQLASKSTKAIAD